MIDWARAPMLLSKNLAALACLDFIAMLSAFQPVEHRGLRWLALTRV